MTSKKKLIIIFLIFFSIACKNVDLTQPIDAEILTKEYQEKKNRSDRRYRYNQIIVKGEINQTFKNNTENLIIVIGNADDIYAISCSMKKDEIILIDPLVQGEIVTIQGFCTGISGHIILEDCIFVK